MKELTFSLACSHEVFCTSVLPATPAITTNLFQDTNHYIFGWKNPLLFLQKTAPWCMSIFSHVKMKKPSLDQTRKWRIPDIPFQNPFEAGNQLLIQARPANQHQEIMPSWLPKMLLWLRKNALCLSQSAFSNLPSLANLKIFLAFYSTPPPPPDKS